VDTAPRLLSRSFVLVTCAAFCYFTALGALLPTLPRFVEDELGGGGAAVGLAVGAFAVSAALLRPWTGRFGDARGRRALVVGGGAVVAVSLLGYTVADSLAVLVALRLLTGVGEAAMWVGAATAVQDLAPDDRRGEAASYFSVALYLGIALGPAIGEAILSAHGFDAVWLFGAAMAALASLFGLATPQALPAPAGADADGVAGRPRRLLHPGALQFGVVLFLGLVAFVGFSTFIPVYGEHVGLDETGGVFAVYAAIVLVIRVEGARVPDALGWRRASTVALISLAGAMAMIALWESSTAIWLSTLPLAVGMAMLFPALFSATVAAAPDHERSEAVGTFSVFFDLANGLGAPALGLVVALSNERGAFAAAAVIALGGLLLVAGRRSPADQPAVAGGEAAL
jgi:predicted MFS family arabinose efflux permease